MVNVQQLQCNGEQKHAKNCNIETKGRLMASYLKKTRAETNKS